jgi:hypothetical protein
MASGLKNFWDYSRLKIPSRVNKLVSRTKKVIFSENKIKSNELNNDFDIHYIVRKKESTLSLPELRTSSAQKSMKAAQNKPDFVLPKKCFLDFDESYVISKRTQKKLVAKQKQRSTPMQENLISKEKGEIGKKIDLLGNSNFSNVLNYIKNISNTFPVLSVLERDTFDKLIYTLKVSLSNAEDFIYAEILNFQKLYRSNDTRFTGYKNTSENSEGSYGFIKLSSEWVKFIGLARACIPDKAGKTSKELEKIYPFVYPDDCFTNDIYDILKEENPEALLKKRMDFLNYKNDKTLLEKARIRAVEKYVQICNEFRIAF